MKRIYSSSNLIFLCVIVLLLFLPGCKTYFIADNFEERTSDHQTFAVLPFEMVFTGKKPEKLTEEDVMVIGDAESKAFMVSFYNEILRSTKGGRKPIRVDVQHYDKTLSILEENGIDIRSSWKEDPGKLADMLGVDAVIKGRIQKHRLMSDLASYGIDLGTHILSRVTNNELLYWLPPGATTTKQIKTNYSLLDNESATLWSIAYDLDADWRQPANEVIEYINRKSVKNFPYRVKN